MKLFEAESGGVRMDANFLSHLEQCERCKQYDHDKPATIAQLCLEGAVLLKQETVSPKRERGERPDYWCSKETLRSVMRYK